MLEDHQKHYVILAALSFFAFIFITISLFSDSWISIGGIVDVKLCCTMKGPGWYKCCLFFMFFVFFLSLVNIFVIIATGLKAHGERKLQLGLIGISAVIALILLFVIILWPSSAIHYFRGFSPSLGYSYIMLFPALCLSIASCGMAFLIFRHHDHQ